jgi:hypothetical protein
MRPADFLAYLRGLGFGICKIDWRFKLRAVPPDAVPAGFNYLLVTRTPEADIAAVDRRRRYPPIRLKRWLARHRPAWGRYRRIWGRY